MPWPLYVWHRFTMINARHSKARFCNRSRIYSIEIEILYWWYDDIRKMPNEFCAIALVYLWSNKRVYLWYHHFIYIYSSRSSSKTPNYSLNLKMDFSHRHRRRSQYHTNTPKKRHLRICVKSARPTCLLLLHVQLNKWRAYSKSYCHWQNKALATVAGGNRQNF